MMLPVEMMRFTNTAWDELTDSTLIRHFLEGNPEQRQAAFLDRSREVLEHFPEVKFVLLPPSRSSLPPVSLGGFLKQLTVLHFSAEQDPWSVGTLGSLEDRCKEVNESMKAEADPPVEVAAKVLYHEDYLQRMKNAREHELDQDEGTGVSKLAGVKTQSFRIASPALQAICMLQGANPNAVFQQAFKHQCRLLVMYLMEVCSAVPNFSIFTSLSPFRGELDLYLGWCLSVESDGSVPDEGKDKKLGAKHVKALKLGLWAEDLDLYNLCRLWELALAGNASAVSFIPCPLES